MARKRVESSPAGELIELTVRRLGQAKKDGQGPRDDELSQSAWEVVRAAIPGEPPQWFHPWLCVLIWCARTGQLHGGAGYALGDDHTEMLTAVVDLSNQLFNAVLQLPFDLQDRIETIIRDRLPSTEQNRYPSDPVTIITTLPHLASAARNVRDESDRSRRSGERRVSKKAFVSAMVTALENAVDRLDYEMQTSVNRKNLFAAVRAALPAEIRPVFPTSYDAQRKQKKRSRARRNGH